MNQSGETNPKDVLIETLREQVARLTAERDDVLAELEKAGWPCRLVELPQLYVDLAQQYVQLREYVQHKPNCPALLPEPSCPCTRCGHWCFGCLPQWKCPECNLVINWHQTDRTCTCGLDAALTAEKET